MSKGPWLAKADAAASATAVVAVSKHSAREFLRLYPAHRRVSGTRGVLSDERDESTSASVRPVWVAHNGVDTSIFRPCNSSDITAFRQVAGLEHGVSYVLVVGARLGYKNARTVLRAMEAANSASNLALVLIGGGQITSEEGELLRGIPRWVHIGSGSEKGSDSPAGTRDVCISDELLAAGYSGATALLHLSVGEGFGLTVLEAFACGCPVVAHDIPPLREIAGFPERPAASSTSASPPNSPYTSLGPSASPRERLSQGDRYPEKSSSLEGGVIFVEDPTSATQVWRAARTLMALDDRTKATISDALVRRAGTFNSWQPLADTILKASVARKAANPAEVHMNW